jgi:hypothetical protein
MHHDHLGRRNSERHRSEALERIVRHFRLNDRLHDQVLICHQDRGPISRCVRRLSCGNGTAGTGRILDEETAAKPLGELLRQDSRDKVVWSTRRIRYDQLDRLGGVCLRNGGAIRRGDAEQG